MNELLRWLFDDGISAVLLVAAFTMFLTYLLAYFQGRALSFWPPRIEGRPLRLAPNSDKCTGVMDAIQFRKSVRTFLDRPVEEDKLKTILIAACAETDNHIMQCGQLSYPIDTTIALDHMTLAAVEQGLGTCWVAMFDEKRVRECLDERTKNTGAHSNVAYPDRPSGYSRSIICADHKRLQ